MLWQKSQRLHPISLLMESINETIVYDNSMSFAEIAFIRMLINITALSYRKSIQHLVPETR
jgi:hypothetical protein